MSSKNVTKGVIIFVIFSCHLLLITLVLVAMFCSSGSFHVSYIIWSSCPSSSAAAITALALGLINDANEMRQLIMVCWNATWKRVIWFTSASRQLSGRNGCIIAQAVSLCKVCCTSWALSNEQNRNHQSPFIRNLTLVILHSESELEDWSRQYKLWSLHKQGSFHCPSP